MKHPLNWAALGPVWLAICVAACSRSPGVDETASAPASSSDGLLADGITPPSTPKAKCGKGSRPEPGLQGRVSQADFDSGLAAAGITCNTKLVGSFTTPSPLSSVGGWKVERYKDSSGHECAYYDATDIFPLGLVDDALGVNVMDMTDPTHPTFVTRLTTPAMLSPHESLVISEKRGLLVAVMSNPAFGPVGVVDIYDVTKDCRHPEFQSSAPVGSFGHESGISPDGRTFFSGTPFTPALTAVDISNPELPVPLSIAPMLSHGLSISADGNRAYVADASGRMKIMDISEIQARKPLPVMREISELTWPTASIPQNAMPFTSKGKPYVLEIDEFGALDKVGAARIIDISDENNPRVISDLRLEVHQPQNFDTIKDDPGASNTTYASYAGHYCNIPTTVDPTIAACSMIMSGLRVFDIRDVYHPKEVAYFNAPISPHKLDGTAGSNGAFSRPAFVPERKEIWYSDSSSGFYAVRVTNDAWK